MSKYEGVHSCGPNCTQPLCVANRRIVEQQKHINTLTNEKLTLQAKVEELTAAKNDAYSRGWVDALAEAYEWRNPTTVLEDK